MWRKTNLSYALTIEMSVAAEIEKQLSAQTIKAQLYFIFSKILGSFSIIATIALTTNDASSAILTTQLIGKFHCLVY